MRTHSDEWMSHKTTTLIHPTPKNTQEDACPPQLISQLLVSTSQVHTLVVRWVYEEQYPSFILILVFFGVGVMLGSFSALALY